MAGPGRTSSPLLRPARRQDAPAISALYRQAYRPANGGDAREHYPFPQFLEDECVEELLRTDLMRWFVAEHERTIVGTCGAVVNIGGPLDRIAESFGLVIDARWQRQNFGSELFRTLCDFLVTKDAAAFIMAETRTSHPGGWKVVRQCGFLPMGFEPFAHATPAGSEAMLMTGRVSPMALAMRHRPGPASAPVCRLAMRVLQELDCMSAEVPPSLPSVRAATVAGGLPAVGATESAGPGIDGMQREGGGALQIHEEAWTGRLPDAVQVAPAGVQAIGLRRLEGDSAGSRRYERSLFVASLDGRIVAHARTSYDRCDQRLRVIELRAATECLASVLIGHILRQRQAAGHDAPFVVIIDARADHPGLHLALEQIGFFPTVYYPALIQEGGERFDVVQFTWLFGRDLGTSRARADLGEWPLACEVVAPITGGR
jgi:RimJ/RimL family protein N-acetyltransferase